MPHMPDPLDEQAIAWIIRHRDPGFGDWEDFARWLDEDPRHAPRYHALAAADADVADVLRQVPVPVTSTRPRPRWLSRRSAGAVSVAAALVASVGYLTRPPSPDLYAVETAPGERRSIALAEGTRIAMNGGTRIVIDRNDPRAARLERGQAVFTVVHDEARPFDVAVGGNLLRDVGTVFDVRRDDGTTVVQVSEGAVVYNPASNGVRVDAGRGLRIDESNGRLTLSPVAPGSVASWQAGRLVYDGEDLAQVAADIARSTGIDLRVAPAMARRPFRGVITIDGDHAVLMRRLGLVLDARVERSQEHWTLTPPQP